MLSVQWPNDGSVFVSMPFRAEATFLLKLAEDKNCEVRKKYQCPFGLRLHFYSNGDYPKAEQFKWVSMPFRAETPFLRTRSDKKRGFWVAGINALSGWDSISTVPLQKPKFYAVSGACFCRYLSEYSDNDHFSCMLTIWTHLIATSTTWIFFSITLILQFVICYF